MANRNLAEALPATFLVSLDKIFAEHGAQRHDKTKGSCSYKTQHERKLILRLAFGQLLDMGYRLPTPQSLGERHVRALATRWDTEGICATTLRTRISALRMFSSWIGKPGMVRLPGAYFDKERIARTGLVTESKAWSAHGLDPRTVIERARALDERLALYLALQHAFGLRVKESIELRPLQALAPDSRSFAIYEGTKGGRPRTINIEDAEQRQVYQWAQAIAAKSRSGRLRWPDLTWKQANNRFFHLVRNQLGISKAESGVTAHGLRHGYAQRKYRALTGLPAPIEGGALGRIDPQVHRSAGFAVSRDLGHSRLQITGTYYGSYGHALRVSYQVNGQSVGEVSHG